MCASSKRGEALSRHHFGNPRLERRGFGESIKWKKRGGFYQNTVGVEILVLEPEVS